MKAKSDHSSYHSINIAFTLLLLWIALVWFLSDKFYLSKAHDLIQQGSIHSQERVDDLTDSIRRNLNYLHGIPDLFSEVVRVKADRKSVV